MGSPQTGGLIELEQVAKEIRTRTGQRWFAENSIIFVEILRVQIGVMF